MVGVGRRWQTERVSQPTRRDGATHVLAHISDTHFLGSGLPLHGKAAQMFEFPVVVQRPGQFAADGAGVMPPGRSAGNYRRGTSRVR